MFVTLTLLILDLGLFKLGIPEVLLDWYTVIGVTVVDVRWKQTSGSSHADAIRNIQFLNRHYSASALEPEGSAAGVGAVMFEMQNRDRVTFSCHGHQDIQPEDPMGSTFNNYIRSCPQSFTGKEAQFASVRSYPHLSLNRFTHLFQYKSSGEGLVAESRVRYFLEYHQPELLHLSLSDFRVSHVPTCRTNDCFQL